MAAVVDPAAKGTSQRQLVKVIGYSASTTRRTLTARAVLG